MRVYILGVCGTFMGSLAVLAKEMGYLVAGCDENIYPPMSTQLNNAGIQLDQGYETSHVEAFAPDVVIVGNALSRGNAVVEMLLNENRVYTSGPEFLHDYIIKDKRVIAVSGTHGKTTTSAMLAWVLETAGLNPGFLVGGVLHNFPFSARLGEGELFVIEADEYDTAFFDKRSKFVHYKPSTLIINNIEFDHADIFNNLEDIKRQFHHVVRLVPSKGQVIYPYNDAEILSVLAKGCWSTQATFSTDDNSADMVANHVASNGSQFTLFNQTSGESVKVDWQLIGEHNVKNALAVTSAAQSLGVSLSTVAKALESFQGVKRRMEKLIEKGGIAVFDDFAHHPSAIKTSLHGVKASHTGRVITVVELASNTMKQGLHKSALKEAVASADNCFFYTRGDLSWALPEELGDCFNDVDALLNSVLNAIQSGDQVVLMSNGSFGGFREKLTEALLERD
ncbi:MAG: UDP-N-acetylmuramate:L-alanyl-gamma-D-glutamyl-meso-diaminopimelate ligase [Cellvibrionales bacterium]|nr:UDP-N-acetylmuramate:L-alanyl-gamma-D-glutamyl-meso-diaminopimelate ligase [Cellvibrionales bacterium]